MAIASQGDLPSWSNYPCPTRYHFFATSDGIAARGNLWRCCENFSAEILSKPYPLNPHTPRHYSPIILGAGEKSRQQKTWRKGETCGDMILLRMEYYGYPRVVFYFFLEFETILRKIWLRAHFGYVASVDMPIISWRSLSDGQLYLWTETIFPQNMLMRWRNTLKIAILQLVWG